MIDADPIPTRTKSKPNILGEFAMGSSGNPTEKLLILLLAAFGGILQLRISRSYSNSLLTAALIYSSLNAVGLSSSDARGRSGASLRVVGIVALLVSLGLSLLAFRSAPGTGRPFYSLNDMENVFPLVAVFGWWCLAARRSEVSVLLRNLVLIALTISLWHIVWEIPALFLGELLINVTVNIASYFIYLAGVDITRVGEVLSIGTGSVRVYLGCTGFPIFQILVKLMIAEWVVFRKVYLTWRMQTLIAAGVAMAVGVLRLGTLAVFAANRSALLFWHGQGSKLFTALAVGIFIIVVGLQRESYDGRPTPEQA